MNVRNLDYIRQKDPRLFEAISDLVQGQRNIAQQVNADPSGEPLPPPAIDSLKVTGQNGHFNVSIQHGGEFYRGVRYYLEHADNPQFNNAHTVQMGDSRNANLFLGNVKRYFRAYAAYPTSKPGPPVYHGGPAEPMPVTGGGIVGAPALLESQGSGTGAAGEGLSGPGALPFRSASGIPPVRGMQREVGGSSTPPSGSAAGLPSGAQVYTSSGGGGGAPAGSVFGAGSRIEGNVPMFDADGLLIDSGKAATDIGTGSGGGRTFVEPNDADFSWINSAVGCSVDTSKGGIYLKTDKHSGLHLRLREKSAPVSTPYTIYAGFNIITTDTDQQRWGIGFRESSSGKIIMWYALRNAGTWKMELDSWLDANNTGGVGRYTGFTYGTQDHRAKMWWLSMRNDGTNLTFGVSWDDGYRWNETDWPATSIALATWGATPDKLVWGGSDDTNTMAASMWLRHWEETT